jgi:kynureninase
MVVVSAVDFRTAELADVGVLTRTAHDHGALVLWDLSHAVGVVPLTLDAWNVDFAVGCTYKYLNAGPGAPAFLYVAKRLHDNVVQPIPGWFGHVDQFAMEADYRPAPGIARFLTGTPNIPGTVAVDAGVGLLAEAGLDHLRAKSIALTTLAIDRADALGLEIATPREANRRGSHVAVRHPNAAALCAALARERGVITDHRPPDIVRLGFAPLYNRFVEVWDAFDAVGSLTA